MLGPLIGAGASLLGGFLGRQHQDEQRARNEQLQREFAQSSIQWKVADAKKAGIHPLYALGAPSISPAVSVQGDPMASAVSSMGQDISRAVNATRSNEDRNDAFSLTVQKMQLQRMGLENELLSSQIARLRDNTNPPMPTGVGVNRDATRRAASRGPQGGVDPYNIGEESQFEERPRLSLGSGAIATDPATANAETFEKRYGDEASMIFAPAIMWRDLIANYGQPETWPRQVIRELGAKLGRDIDNEYDNARRFFGFRRRGATGSW